MQTKLDRLHPKLNSRSVDKYLNAIQRPRDRVLGELEKDAIRNDVPIAGPLIGGFLSTIARSSGAKKILEIGTATGYSGIWFARAARDNSGKLVTIELDPERVRIAKSAFEKARLKKNVQLIQGDAIKIVKEMASKARKSSGEFDIVFNDIYDKRECITMHEDCLALLKKGGLYIVDDTLFRGVAVPSVKGRKTEAMRKFNKLVFADKRLEPTIVPIGDGITVAVKK